MPFLPDELSTDKLLKNFAIHLFQHFDSRQLRDFGWYQYRDHDRLNTLVSTELAAHAFLYLSFDAGGAWRRNPSVVTATIAFLARYFDISPQEEDLRRLKQIIDSKPLDRQAITDWFHAVYPPDPAPQ